MNPSPKGVSSSSKVFHNLFFRSNRNVMHSRGERVFRSTDFSSVIICSLMQSSSVSAPSSGFAGASFADAAETAREVDL